jgi:HEPN domain
MDETWQHGSLIGGMACRDLSQVASAYKLAADELLKQAQTKYEPHELDYPVLFLYRHTVELYLKAALNDPPEHHDLSRLIQLLEAECGKMLAGWIKDRLWDFHRIDNMAALFRYADPPADGELWIDFHQLQTVIEKMVQAIEQYMEQKRRVDQSGGYGSA